MSLLTRGRTLLVAGAMLFSAAVIQVPQSQAAVFISVNVAPPALPVYTQPPLPAPGYIWTPGYWAYGPGGYYWVPGVWVAPPRPGLLWTPAYWGWEGGAYLFHPGYWGPHVGFYGGVNYGFGYFGSGFGGGEWRGGSFFYNSAAANFGSVHVTNIYVNKTVIVNNTTINRVSYNGGNGGIQARPTQFEANAMRENHIVATNEQMQHQTFASQNRAQFASANGGRPGVMAAATPASFHANPTNPAAAARFNPNQREANQDQRIANGLHSGQMTSGEAAQAERTQANIDRQVHNDRVANGGALTPQERQQVNREQNAASHQIYNDNHNANRVAPNAVNNREAYQQQRVANGLRDGQLNSGQAARDNRQQAGIAQQVHNERVANGGAMTQQQRQQVNREQNHAGRQINREEGRR